jgi:hypothetical protein
MNRKLCRTASLALAASLFCLAVSLSTLAIAVPVLVPDAGGTAQMPILSDYIAQSPMQIIDGLPPATTIDIAALLKAPLLYEEVPGGILGGTKAGGGGPLFQWNMTGTGALLGFNRNIVMPGLGGVLTFPAVITPSLNTNSAFEVHTAPRTLGDPNQCFDTDMFRLFSQIVNPSANDPDFDLLRVVAGTDFGLPSPGHTDLLQNGGNWEVDSFFDITYRIDFVGRPGGALAGMSGSTTGVVHFSLGDPIVCIPEPTSIWLAGSSVLALVALARRRS